MGKIWKWAGNLNEERKKKTKSSVQFTSFKLKTPLN